MIEDKQEQGEPVAEIKGFDGNGAVLRWFTKSTDFPAGAKFYTTPQQRKPLTSEEVKNLVVKHSYEFHTDGWGRQCFLFGRDDLIAFVKDVEIVHGIKE